MTAMTTTPFIRLHPADDVLIARAQLVGGTQVENITVRGLIPAGHKIATRALAAGEPVRRYNQIIGFASKPIAPGGNSSCRDSTSPFASIRPRVT